MADPEHYRHLTPPPGTVVNRFWHGSGEVSWYDLPADSAETCGLCEQPATVVYFTGHLRARDRIYRCAACRKACYASDLIREWPDR